MPQLDPYIFFLTAFYAIFFFLLFFLLFKFFFFFKIFTILISKNWFNSDLKRRNLILKENILIIENLYDEIDILHHQLVTSE